MKNRKRIVFIAIAVAFVLCCCATAVGICLSYFGYVSERTKADSAAHITEVYTQVNNQFRRFIEKNDGILKDLSRHLPADKEGAKQYIEDKKENWKFTGFYFLTKKNGYIEGTAPDLKTERFAFAKTANELFENKKTVLSEETLSSLKRASVFAAPASGVYDGVEYSAIAVSYISEDLIESLSVKAFSEASVFYIVDTDGEVLLSSKKGGSVVNNYRNYLSKASDLTTSDIDKIFSSVADKIGTITATVDKEKYHVFYQSVEDRGLTLIGLVSVAAASAGLMQIQSATIYMLVGVFAVVLVLGLAVVGYKFWQTKRKSATELRFREMLFDILNVKVDDIFIMLDVKTLHPDYLSPNVERLLGVERKDVLENIKLLDATIADEDKIDVFSGIPVNDCRSVERAHIHRKTGEKRWFTESVYHEVVDGVEKYIVVMSDRTADREMKQRLEQAMNAAKSANEAKSNFLSNMSHDIRTPMNAIIGLSVLLAKDAERPDKVREYTRKISSSGQHLLSLINDVLDMSKIESGKTSLDVGEFRLPDVLDGIYTVMSPQARAKEQELEIHAKGSPPDRLLGDKLHLNQILLNLVSNAIKYTGVGGKINLTVQSLERTSAQFAKIRFIVADNGFGMSKEFLKDIFSPFSREVTSKTGGIQGTGLGMTITKNLVDLMGGTIDVKSELGVGSTFTVDITFAVPSLSDEEDFWKKNGVTRVLVADDEQFILDDISSSLRAAGLSVTCVKDGKEAVAAVVNANKEGIAYDVVLIDWKMPVMDGVAAVKEMHKKLKAKIPTIILSSYDWSEIEEAARAVGVDAFMTKPFFVSAFRYTLEALKTRERTVSTNDESPLVGMTFLAAEDNEINAEILSELLAVDGARYELAKNGKEALEKFLRSEKDEYDMIFMDVQMPIMNGYEATEAIRTCSHPRAKTIPIIAMTANAFAEDIKNALDAGMNAHLSKPIDMNAVRAVVAKYKEEKPQK